MFKMSQIHISKNIINNILFFITLALAVNFIMNKQITALLSLFIIAGLIYYYNKNITIALLISIIVTNLLLAINYLEAPQIEKMENNKNNNNTNTNTNTNTNNDDKIIQS